MSRFGVLKQKPESEVQPAPKWAPADQAAAQTAVTTKPPRQDRAGKKMVGGHFSGDLSRAINILAAEQDKTVQALVGEALDDLLRKHGKHPFGER